MSRKLPDFCYRDPIPLDKVSDELYACHIRCFEEYYNCDDIDCESDYELCLLECCEKYVVEHV